MQVIVLGSGTALPSTERGAPAFLVKDRDTHLLLDCGSGALQRLLRTETPLSSLDGIVLSHTHLDHCADLFPLLFALQVPGADLPAQLQLHLGPGGSQWLEGARQALGLREPPETELLVVEHRSDTFYLGSLEIQCRPLRHHPTSIGLRVSNNHSALAYLGDTGLCEEAIELCQQVDLALLECSYDDAHATRKHLCPRDIAAIAAKAQPEAIILTHLYPEALTGDVLGAIAAHGCEIPTAIAEDGMGMALAREDS